MPERVTELVILVEDARQRDLIRYFIKAANLMPRHTRINMSPPGQGSAAQYVRKNYSAEVRAIRASSRRRKATLIAMVDADTNVVAARRGELRAALGAEPPVSQQEPIFLLIPKRNVETWIRHCLAEIVDETTDYSRRLLDASDIRAAARRLLTDARTRPQPPAPDSLAQALPTLRRIAHA